MTSSESMRRMTSFAVVERIAAIHPHRDPRIERLEVLELSSGVRLVTGKHYRVGDLGVYLRPGCLIPGMLAEQLWLVGKQRAAAWFEVRAMPIGLKDAPDELKEPSLGLWAGEWYRHDNTAESVLAWNERGVPGAMTDPDGYVHWKFWRAEWAAGHCLDGHFGIVEAKEQPKGTKHERRFTAAELKPSPKARRDPSELEQVTHPFRVFVRAGNLSSTQPIEDPFIRTIVTVTGWDLVRALLRRGLTIHVSVEANHWAVTSRLLQKIEVWKTRGLPKEREAGIAHKHKLMGGLAGLAPREMAGEIAKELRKNPRI